MANDTVSIDMWLDFGKDTKVAYRNAVNFNRPVASDAVRSAGLTTGVDIGGPLGALDMKRVDVRTAISMSLMETFVTTDELYELVADNYGGVEFIKIGDGNPGLGRYYYSTQTTTFNNKLTDVMVVGGKPLPEIKFGDWYNVLTEKSIYTTQTMFENCRKSDFIKYASIVYPDPHLNTQYGDNIDNIYDVDDPFERVVGYVHYANPNLQNRPDVKITWSAESSIPLRLNEDRPPDDGAGLENPPYVYMGKLQEIRHFDDTVDVTARYCFGGLGDRVSYSDGVPIRIPDKWRYETTRGVVVDNFIRVSAVYIVGLEIDLLFFAPKSPEVMFDTPTVNNSMLWASFNKYQFTTFKCEEGRHYAVAFDDEQPFKNPYIVFGKETRFKDPFPYGSNTRFRVDPICNWARMYPELGGKEIIGTVFPTSKTSGILVYDIWVVVDVETPSINIYDPEGKAHIIADNFQYFVRPLRILDPPAPIATHKFGLIDQRASVKNADPTDVQDFTTTDLEKALDAMQGNGFSVTWSFLDESQVEQAAHRLYALLQEQDVVETVYTCGPDANPRLGARVNNGYINSIRYSYTDQGSYTISVTVGPKLPPSSIVQVDGGPTALMAEDVSAKGVIIQSAGDNINFKVRIDGYGERWAMCMAPVILRVGDVVQCSIHNNPIEY